jgi:TonB family protein
MSVAERHLDPSPDVDELNTVLERVKAGDYADALQALTRAKATDPRNIFIIALEKQIGRLRAGGILPREKTEILDSLAGLVERAKAARQSHPSSSQAAAKPVRTATGERKDPRLKLVVDQYFKHADEWIRRGDFEAAEKEIERILLIDPANRMAKEYQARIREAVQTDPAVGGSPGEESAGHEGQTVSGAQLESTPSGRLASAPLHAEEAAGSSPRRKLMFVALAILVVAGMVAGVMVIRPGGAKYKPGLMYVMQAPVASLSEEVPIPATTTSDNVASPALQDEAATVPEIKPPVTTEAKPAPKEEGAEKPARREPAVKKDARPERGSEAESKTEARVKKASEKTAELLAPRKASPSAAAAQPSSEKRDEPPAKSESAEEREPFIPVEQPPRIITLDQPQFSDEDIAGGIKGEVVVKVQIDKSGKPLQAKILSSSNGRLNGPVIDAIMRSKFAPGVMSNGPITTWMTIPLKLK